MEKLKDQDFGVKQTRPKRCIPTPPLHHAPRLLTPPFRDAHKMGLVSISPGPFERIK